MAAKYDNQLIQSFYDWFHQIENYGTKSERYFDYIKYNPNQSDKWLLAAYLAGVRQIMNEMMAASERVGETQRDAVLDVMQYYQEVLKPLEDL